MKKVTKFGDHQQRHQIWWKICHQIWWTFLWFTLWALILVTTLAQNFVNPQFGAGFVTKFVTIHGDHQICHQIGWQIRHQICHQTTLCSYLVTKEEGGWRNWWRRRHTVEEEPSVVGRERNQALSYYRLPWHVFSMFHICPRTLTNTNTKSVNWVLNSVEEGCEVRQYHTGWSSFVISHFQSMSVLPFKTGEVNMCGLVSEMSLGKWKLPWWQWSGHCWLGWQLPRYFLH